MKNLFILFSILCSGPALFAAGPGPLSDTTKKTQLATNTCKNELLILATESNVVFPAIISDAKDASLNYVENFSEKRRDYLIRIYNRGRKFFPKTEKILKKYNLPKELRVLLALESGFNPNAVSRAGAVGYWQIMDAVAKEYGLAYTTQLSPEEKRKLIKGNPKAADSLVKALAKQKDDRKNLLKSTTVAAKYLKDRYRNLGGNCLLVVASYNCGIGNVWNAMEKTGKKNPDFWDIKNYLPEETRNYVMNFITLNVIFNNYDLFVKNKLRFTTEQIVIPVSESNINCETVE